MIEKICIERFADTDGEQMVSLRIALQRCELAAHAEDTDLGFATALESMAGMIRRHVKFTEALSAKRNATEEQSGGA